jgi:predicted enzyme related to lactoylglutathione lyase
MDRIDHVLTVFAVSDVPAMVAFYEQAFGWPRRAEAGSGTLVRSPRPFHEGMPSVPDPI